MIPFLTRSARLKLLEEKLREVSRKPLSLSVRSKDLMKKRVLRRIDEAMEREELGFEQLAQELEKLTLTVEPTSRFKVHTREYVMDFLTLRTQRLWLRDLFRDLFARKRYWATAMAGLVLFVSAFGTIARFPHVSAAKVSSVESVRGSVFVGRAGESVSVTPGFLIQEGDRLMSGDDGWMDVVFADDSLLTIGPGTRAAVSTLWTAPENEAHTSVSVEVEQGRAWATVLNLLPNDSSFELKSGDFAASVARRGSFDLVVMPDMKRLRVFSDLVEFSVREQGVMHSGTVGPDFEVLLSDRNLSIGKIADAERLRADDVWVQSNINNRATHRLRLGDFYARRVEQRAGVLPGDLRYRVKRGMEQARLLISLDGKTREDLRLSFAETRFAEATALAHQGESEGSKKVLEDYQSALVALAQRGPEAATSVQALIEENKKVVEAVAPEGPLYELRFFVDETAVLLASSDSERQVLQLETTADRLGLALELIQIGAYDLAQIALEDYQVGFSHLLDEVSALEFDQRRDVVLEVLDQKLRDLGRLKLIGGELDRLSLGESHTGTAIQDQLRSLHQDTLYQLNTLILTLKERAVLHLKTFLEDTKGESVIQLEVLGRLKKSVPLDLEFISLINQVESLYADEGSDVMIVNDRLVTPKSDGELPLQILPEGRFEGSGLPEEREVRQE